MVMAPRHPELREAPTDAAPVRVEARPRVFSGVISRESAWRVGMAWLVLFPLAVALEPVPAASASDPWWAVAVGLAFLGIQVATAVGLVRRRRWGLAGSAAGVGLFLVGAVLCPVTGHHALGWWWAGQLAAGAGIGWATLRALLRDPA